MAAFLQKDEFSVKMAIKLFCLFDGHIRIVLPVKEAEIPAVMLYRLPVEILPVKGAVHGVESFYAQRRNEA